MRVAAIRRYPVKSLQGELLDEVELDEGGLAGDRLWGVVDRSTGKVWSAKRHAALLDASARTTPAGPLVTLPDGTEVLPDDPDRDDRLSDWLGADVCLARADAAPPRVYEASLQLDPDVDVFDVPMGPTRFLDLSPVHLLTTASLATAAAHHPDGTWSADRFRPSFLVETNGDDHDGFAENTWVGRKLVVGAAELDVVLPTVRCVMTTCAQPPLDLARDLGILESLIRSNQQNLGVYADVRAGGTVRVGDRVELVP